MASEQGRHWLIESNKWTRKPLAYWVQQVNKEAIGLLSPTIHRVCVTRPSEIFVNFIFKHIDAPSINTICR